MKKFICYLSCFILLYCTAKAQEHEYRDCSTQQFEEKKPFKNVLYIEPKALLSRGFEFGYQRNIGEKFSAAFNLALYHNTNSIILYPEAKLYSGQRIQLTLKRYLKPKTTSLLPYLCGTILFKQTTLTPVDDTSQVRSLFVKSTAPLPYTTKQHATAFGIGALAGLELKQTEPFFLDSSFGLIWYESAASHATREQVERGLANPFLGVFPRLNFSLGFRF